MSPTIKKPRRIIQVAMIEGIGPISAHELLAMPEDDWGIIRDRITDYASGKPDGRVALCLRCDGRVFIQTRVLGNKRLPYFVHYAGSDPSCPWFQGKTLPPDAARAAQYGGAQESVVHRMLCEQINQLVRLDARYVTSSVGQYHAPMTAVHGRYPDVYVEWQGFRPFAIELQLSNTFQTEVSGRSTYYEREGVVLVWVLSGVDPQNDEVAQSFRDVIRRHRGNAFVLDLEAVEASKNQNTLVLKCYLKNAKDTYDPPVVVRLDELKVPERGLPFFEDRITALLRQRINARRKPWFNALTSGRPSLATQSAEISNAFAELERLFPKLSDRHAAGEEERFEIFRLIAVAFSVLSTASGRWRNYASKHENIKGMLNTFLNMRSGFPVYALVIEYLLRSTSVHALLDGSVGQHVDRAKHRMGGNLCFDGDPEWEIMRYLVPEVFDPIIRDELAYLDALPVWAIAP